MIYVNVNQILQKQKKSKYWLVKNLGCSYQSISNLINNETTAIRFETLDKICEVLNCEPGDIIVREKNIVHRRNKHEQTTKAI